MMFCYPFLFFVTVLSLIFYLFVILWFFIVGLLLVYPIVINQRWRSDKRRIKKGKTTTKKCKKKVSLLSFCSCITSHFLLWFTLVCFPSLSLFPSFSFWGRYERIRKRNNKQRTQYYNIFYLIMKTN